MQLLRKRLIYTAAIRTVNGSAKSVDYTVSLAFDGLYIALAAPVFRFLKLGATVSFNVCANAAAEWTRQDRRFPACYQDHLPIQFGIRIYLCGSVVHEICIP